MSLSKFFGWSKTVDKAIDVVDQLVTDKDQANALKHDLERLKQEVYITELNTKTVPWVDALHKMGRQILSVLQIIVPAVLLYLKPDIDPLAIIGMAGPAGVYNYVKGVGK